MLPAAGERPRDSPGERGVAGVEASGFSNMARRDLTPPEELARGVDMVRDLAEIGGRGCVCEGVVWVRKGIAIVDESGVEDWYGHTRMVGMRVG